MKITHAAFSPFNNELILTGSDNGCLQLYDIWAGKNP